jgi:hypothetical protein
MDLTDIHSDDHDLQKALVLSLQESRAWAGGRLLQIYHIEVHHSHLHVRNNLDNLIVYHKVGDANYRGTDNPADADFEDQLAMALAASLETATRESRMMFSSPTGKKHALEFSSWGPTSSQLSSQKDINAQLLSVPESELIYLNPSNLSESSNLQKRMKQQAQHVSSTEVVEVSHSSVSRTEAPSAGNKNPYSEDSTDTAITATASYSSVAGALNKQRGLQKEEELIHTQVEGDLASSLGDKSRILRSFLRNQKVGPVVLLVLLRMNCRHG